MMQNKNFKNLSQMVIPLFNEEREMMRKEKNH